MNAVRTLSQAEALGIIKGALLAMGCEPPAVVWERVAKKLSASRDPIALAKLAVERVVSAREGERVWDVFATLGGQS